MVSMCAGPLSDSCAEEFKHTVRWETRRNGTGVRALRDGVRQNVASPSVDQGRFRVRRSETVTGSAGTAGLRCSSSNSGRHRWCTRPSQVPDTLTTTDEGRDTSLERQWLRLGC